MTDRDDYVGEIYQSLDRRSDGRRIRILEIHPDQSNPRPYDGTHKSPVYYRAVRIDEFGKPHGQRVKIADTTLDDRKYYFKTSH